MPFIVFSPFILSCSLNRTKRKRLKQYTLTHYFVYDNGRAKKINQDQGRKQTAERLNFRFYFYFLSFFYG